MEGLLSPDEGRKGHRIYLWHGSQDSVVPASSAINSYSFLHQLLPPSASIYLDNKVPANHGLSSLHRGSPCGQRENRESFVERCNVSTVHRMLNHLFGPNQPLPEENQENGLEHNLKGEVGFWSFSCVTLSILGYFWKIHEKRLFLVSLNDMYRVPLLEEIDERHLCYIQN